MKTSEVSHSWANILAGFVPSLYIEITKGCRPCRPGCYASDTAPPGSATYLRIARAVVNCRKPPKPLLATEPAPFKIL
jgi:hypothetical protein